MRGLVELPWWGFVCVALAMTHITIVAVTIYLHRNQAHGAVVLHPIVSHFFRSWLWLTTGMVTKEWVAIHRKHHVAVETFQDPHSPQVKGLPRVLFGGVFLYVDASHNADTMTRYGKDTPDDWLERRVYTPLHKHGIMLMLAIDVALFGLLPGALIWGVQMVWIPFWAAGVINGIGHYWGYRRFACADASTNIIPWGILIGGEELHNNHHAFVSSAKLSRQWFEFDIGWFYIRIMAIMKLAQVRVRSPDLRFVKRSMVDFETLQAVIVHRYDVLARFIKALQSLAVEECKVLNIASPDCRQLTLQLKQAVVTLPLPIQSTLSKTLARSDRLAKAYAMRHDLELLWAHSGRPRQQLVAHLRDWIARAESSGIRQLEEFSRRLRQYAL
jgi:stearoyl-CoA desaturase (delta-9 desaturase)